MNLMTFQPMLTAAYAPWLPDVALARWAQHGTWGVMLGVAVLALGAKLHLHWQWRWALSLGVALWSLWPGPASPAYWLGLAFQAPSLMAVVLGVVWVCRLPSRRFFADHRSPTGAGFWWVLVVVLVLLGWVLLLDMLAWWPVSVYAWGFGPAALALACGLTVLLWFLGGASQPGRNTVWCLATVLTVFVVTRLPSGNLWDALLDPCLWLVLQVAGGVNLWRSRFSARPWSAATHA